MKSRFFCGVSVVAVALSSAFWAPAAFAATAAASTTTDASTAEVSEVVVTGSLIVGTPKDAAIPVDVVSTENLAKQGSPTVLQLVKTLTASTSGLGESNRYNGGAGTATVNLRGFGSSRTLVLFNGRRMADTPQAAFQGGGADLNFIPSAAIGRVEILKDGAAATYGSEAIGGVVNFITRTDLKGFEVEGDYSSIRNTKGDYRGSIAWGWKGDAGNILLTAGYRHRSRLDAQDRSWAVKPFQSPFYGGWSGNSNPGNYIRNVLNGPATTLFRDNGCNELGGQLTITSAVAANGIVPIATPIVGATCRFQFTNFNDLVNQEDHYQLYGEVNLQVSETTKFHAEVAWTRENVPDIRISPANGNTQFPTPTSLGGDSGSLSTPGALNFFVRYNVPGNNPGLLDLTGQAPGSSCAIPATLYPGACATIIGDGAKGVDISQTAFRFIANAGAPGGLDGADRQQVQTTSWRASAGFHGTMFGNIHWDTNILYMNSAFKGNISDLLVDRVQLALDGYGSKVGASAADSCNPSKQILANAGNAAVGCYFFNPFTNSVAVSATNHQTNPFYRGTANPAVINNVDVLKWLYGNYDTFSTNQLMVAEGLLSADLPITLPGGAVQAAAGVQYRWDRSTVTYGRFFNNQITPCVDSVNDGTPICGAPNGPLIFFGSNANSDYTRTVGAIYGEIKAPITDTFEIDFAARFEHFSNGIGNTTNPKVSAKWQVMPWFALRGSAGTTFRAPSSAAVNPGCAIGVANLGGQYRAVQTCGNATLVPETAKNYNVGFIVEHAGFLATLDYYRINFKGELTTETSASIYGAMFPTAAGHCGDPAFAPLQARFQFAGGTCLSTNVLRVDTFVVNGPSTMTDGLDLRLSYDWGGWWDANYQVGVEGTRLMHYQRGAFTLLGAPQITFAAAFDRAGTSDLQSAFFSFPQDRANFWLNFHKNNVNLRYQVRYQEGTRAAIGTANDVLVPVPVDATHPEGYAAGTIGKTKDFWQHDLTVQYQAPWNVTITASIQNIFDTGPSFAPSNYNYDYTTGNPLGRVFEIGAKAKF